MFNRVAGTRVGSGLILFLTLLGWPCRPGATPQDGPPPDQDPPVNVAAATPAPTDEIKQASLEDLMDMEISSVNRRPQKLSQAAAAVYVITREDIRRFGANSIPEALRMAPGIEVAQIDASKWAISARGFNGRFANKLLVLIDGRSIYTNLYSGVYWDQNDVMIEDVERIEVIRGPGATMWGSNAMNGVINIITRASSQTQGGLVAVGTATDEPASMAARYGGKIGENTTYRFFTKDFDRSSQVEPNGQSANDSWDSLRAGGRIDYDPSKKDKFTFEGDIYRGHSSEMLNSGFLIPNALPAVQSFVDFNGGYALARWEHHLSERSETDLQIYFTQENRLEQIANAYVSTVDVDFQHHIHLNPRNDLVWGLEGRFTWNNTPTKDASLGVSFNPVARNDTLFATFLQDDFAVVPDRVVLSLGTKFEASPFGGPLLEPRVQALWTPQKRQSYWMAVSSAARTPSIIEQDVQIAFPASPAGSPLPVVAQEMGNKNIEAERMNAYEIGFRHQLRHNLSTDVAAFFNDYSKLANYVQGQPYIDTSGNFVVVPISPQNTGAAETKGVEVSGDWRPTSNWRLAGNFSWLHMTSGGMVIPGVESLDDPGRDPTHQWHLRSEWQVTRRLALDSAIYSVAPLPAEGIPSYTRADVRLGWRLQERMELSIGGKNLLDPRHAEFVSESYPQNSLTRRSFYTKLMWAF